MAEISLREFMDILPVGVWFTGTFVGQCNTRDSKGNPRPATDLSARRRVNKWTKKELIFEIHKVGGIAESYVSLDHLTIHNEGRGVFLLAYNGDKFLQISDIRSEQAYTRQGRAPWQRG